MRAERRRKIEAERSRQRLLGREQAEWDEATRYMYRNPIATNQLIPSASIDPNRGRPERGEFLPKDSFHVDKGGAR